MAHPTAFTAAPQRDLSRTPRLLACGALLAGALAPVARAGDAALAEPLVLALHADGVATAHADLASLPGSAALPAVDLVVAALPCAPWRAAPGAAGGTTGTSGPRDTLHWRDRLAVVAQQGAVGAGARLDWAGLGLGAWALGGLSMDSSLPARPSSTGMGPASAAVDCPRTLADALGVMTLLASPRVQRASAGFSASSQPSWRWALRRHGVRVALLDGRGGHLGLDLSVRRREDAQGVTGNPGGDRRETRLLLRWRVAL